jgi:predicted Zn-dependent protease
VACSGRRLSRFVHREAFVLVLLIGVTAAGFFATRAVARSNESMRREQAAIWFGEAQQSMRTGRTEAAVTEFRHAVSKDPSNKRYHLALAEALAAAGHDDEARRILLSIHDAERDDPETSLQLARREARGPDSDSARRFYQTAVADLWRPDEAEERRRLRVELIEFLLARGEKARALSELLLLGANIPPSDPGVQTHVGRMFLAAGDPRHALEYLLPVIRQHPDDGSALTAAGEAAFQLGDYSRAVRYLTAAPTLDDRLTDMREVARLVVNTDPLATRIGIGERRKRLDTGLAQASHRLESCLNDSSGVDDKLHDLRDELESLQRTLRRPRRDSRDLVDDGAELVYRVERAVQQACPTPVTPLDRALLLIGEKRGFEEQ